jgi:parvulin-like peptidyl-prolyl isomerase
MGKCLLVYCFMLLISASIVCFQTAFAVETVVATVGDIKISSVDLDELLERYVPPGGYHAAIQLSQKEKYRGEALNELIEIELLYKEAQKRKVPVSDDVVTAVVESNVRRYGSDKKLQTALEKQGMTMKTLREKIRKHQMVLGLLGQLYESAGITEDGLRSYYDKNISSFKRPDTMRLYHILIKADVSDPEPVWREKKKKAEELLAKIKAGGDFGEIAYKYSEDPYRVKYGDMGFVHRWQITPPELEDAAFSLKKDEVSGVVRTIYGFHILKAGEKKPAETLPFDEVEDRLKRELVQERYDAARKDLIENLKKEFSVKILIELPAKEGDAKAGGKKGPQ